MTRFVRTVICSILYAAAFGPLTIAFDASADDERAGVAMALVDFDYVDTSGEVRDQRADHEARLSVFMNTLRADLAAHGKFRVVVPACQPDPCLRAGNDELLKAARTAGADFLLVGGIHKMSTLVQWAKADVIDLRSGRIVLDKLFTFRGDTDQAWQRAEQFIANELSTFSHSGDIDRN
jgi:hypothetical protein